jgi:hypothetical protein
MSAQVGYTVNSRGVWSWSSRLFIAIDMFNPVIKQNWLYKDGQTYRLWDIEEHELWGSVNQQHKNVQKWFREVYDAVRTQQDMWYN